MHRDDLRRLPHKAFVRQAERQGYVVSIVQLDMWEQHTFTLLLSSQYFFLRGLYEQAESLASAAWRCSTLTGSEWLRSFANGCQMFVYGHNMRRGRV